ncbi:hypothetical protein F5Y16DRAFT_400754 [Xylariaceae sp. FL0255]|nr:hypothetical protein F5Y16DRAFT_400754 [Xylariaceae sp. FL0255]
MLQPFEQCFTTFRSLQGKYIVDGVKATIEDEFNSLKTWLENNGAFEEVRPSLDSRIREILEPLGLFVKQLELVDCQLTQRTSFSFKEELLRRQQYDAATLLAGTADLSIQRHLQNPPKSIANQYGDAPASRPEGYAEDSRSRPLEAPVLENIAGTEAEHESTTDDDGYPPDETPKLRPRMFDESIDSTNRDQRFVPEGSLEKILTFDSVQKELRQTDLKESRIIHLY